MLLFLSRFFEMYPCTKIDHPSFLFLIQLAESSYVKEVGKLA